MAYGQSIEVRPHRPGDSDQFSLSSVHSDGPVADYRMGRSAMALVRREFIALLGGAAAWPVAARAQQRERMRRIGVLTNQAADDPEAQARMGAFLQGLQEFGWAVGRNVR